MTVDLLTPFILNSILPVRHTEQNLNLAILIAHFRNSHTLQSSALPRVSHCNYNLFIQVHETTMFKTPLSYVIYEPSKD